jgi:hypothetical protein
MFFGLSQNFKVFAEVNKNWWSQDFFAHHLFMRAIEGDVVKASLESSDAMKNLICSSQKLGEYPNYRDIKMFLRSVYQVFFVLDWELFNKHSTKLEDVPNSPFDWTKWDRTGLGNNWFRREIILARLSKFRMDVFYSSEFSASVCNEDGSNSAAASDDADERREM